MIQIPSPIDTLTAYGLAFVSGMLFTLLLQGYLNQLIEAELASTLNNAQPPQPHPITQRDCILAKGNTTDEVYP